jgi:hypothetical protein
VSTTGHTEPLASALGGPTTHTTLGPPDSVPPPAGGLVSPPPPGGLPPDYNASAAIEHPMGSSWWDRCRNWFTWGEQGSNCNRTPFQSDHAFDCLVSPVTSPFLFEDPRSLTEVRPIFIYQTAPSKNPIFHGGNSEFFGLQARLAFTERFSLVVNEFGFVSIHPNRPEDGVERATGFAQIRLGPKYTFYRNTNTGGVAAAGLTLEVPTGSRRDFQNTGDLGLDPYVSYGQSFGRLPSGFGSFDFLGTAGYSFATDDKRSEYLHAHLHLDYNIANANRFYPFVEANWLYYTKHGRESDLGFEGADLVNFGSRTTDGRSFLSLATGMRYAYNEHFQAGVGLEWPVTREQGLADFRLTLDLIFRY